MSDEHDPVHRRRPRYPGTHPRRFSEKYKELAPAEYPEMALHVRAQGRTPAGQHVPVMVDEVIAALGPRPGDRVVDATVGWGGHATHLLSRIAPGGRLLALDADPLELPRTLARLRAGAFDEAAIIGRRTNFAGLHAALGDAGWPDGADVIFADLGVSSMQLDDPERGFSFKADGPLDMRMNPRRGVSAAAWIESASPELLAETLRENADEPHADAIARALAERREPIATTKALAVVVRTAVSDRVRADAAELAVRRVFQAIRMAVNDELGALDAFLRQAPSCLRPGGRIAVLTFHSGEDRRVKQAFVAGRQRGAYAEVSPGVIRPRADERRANPRAAPAKLRWARRDADPG